MARMERPDARLRWLIVSAAVTITSLWMDFEATAQAPPGRRAPALLKAPADRNEQRKPIIAKAAQSPSHSTPAAITLPAAALPSSPPPAASSSPASQVPDTFTPSEEFQQWITSLAREHLPDKYEKTKNWGHTTKVWDGVKLRLEDGRLETKRRWKQANDGTWYKYRVDLVEPEKHFDIRIRNIREIGRGRISADIQAVARLKCFGRMSQWEHGVQLLSLSADAETFAVVTTQVELRMQLDFAESPPAVVLVPEVRTARVDLHDFRLQRVSNAKGPVVKSLSSSVREVVEDRLEQQNQGKLAEKLNKQIARQQDKLRLKLPDVVGSPWAVLLPKDAAP